MIKTNTIEPYDGDSVSIPKLKLDTVLDSLYPVGSLYWTQSETFNPNKSFVGTWDQIQDKFVLAAGKTYDNENSGGSATAELLVENLPEHSHYFTPEGTVSGGTHIHDVKTPQSKFGISNAYPSSSASVLVLNGPGTAASYGTYANYSFNNSNYPLVKGGSHTHDFKGKNTLTETTGKGTEFSIMPPYEGAYCWRRIS